MASATYIFDKAEGESELGRLRALEALFDPHTERLLAATGEWRGRSCLEVGAGAGSIAEWMHTRVGPLGRVLAVDINVRFLDKLPAAVEVIQGDVREVTLSRAPFDVIHVRYVIVHNPLPETILSSLVESLAPGGWLLVEEPDFTAARGLAGESRRSSAFDRVNAAMLQMFSERGQDASLGRHVPRMLRERGLDIFDVEWDTHAARGGTALARMMSRSAAQLTDQYVATGAASSADVAEYREFAEDPGCWGVYYATVRTLARRRML